MLVPCHDAATSRSYPPPHGAAIAGFLIDGVGHAGAYAAAAGFAIVGALVDVVFVRGFPDLRGRDASPIPDTEPVPVIT